MAKSIQTIKMDRDFYEAVENLATIQSEKSFPNSSENHAVAVFKAIFKTAKGNVRIYAENLCGRIPNSDEYINGLKDFIVKRKGKVEILLEEQPGSENLKEKPIFKMLRSLNEKSYEIKQTNARATLEYGNSEQEINFTTGGDTMYRIEYDKFNKKAWCCFNSEKVTNKLNVLFDTFFPDATPVKLAGV